MWFHCFMKVFWKQQQQQQTNTLHFTEVKRRIGTTETWTKQEERVMGKVELVGPKEQSVYWRHWTEHFKYYEVSQKIKKKCLEWDICLMCLLKHHMSFYEYAQIFVFFN